MANLEFNEEKHEYTLDGKKLISVTQLMQKHGLAADYSAVDPEILKKKAERGTFIHKEIEEYIKEQKEGFTEELFAFIDFINENNYKVSDSELMVNNDIVAGTIDLICLDEALQPTIADIKTTYSIHKDAVSWQLSIYLYLYLNKFSFIDVIEREYSHWKGKVFHFDNDHKLEVVEIALQPYDEVRKLIDCERLGTKFEISMFTNDKIEKITSIVGIIKDCENRLKAAQEEYDLMINEIRNQMEARNLKEFTSGNVKFECKGGKKATTRTTRKTIFDEEGFKNADIKAYNTYLKYVKVQETTSNVAAVPNKVTITILEDKNDGR